MAVPLNARGLIDRVRARIADPYLSGDPTRGDVWTDYRILEVGDEVLETFWSQQRLAGRDHDLQYLDVSLSTLLPGYASDSWLYNQPEWVAAIRKIEAPQPGDGTRPLPIEQVELEGKDAYRPNPVWFRSAKNALTLIGAPLRQVSTIRIWYLRRWFPLQRGALTSATSVSLVLPADPVGKIVLRDSVYVGQEIEITSGAAKDKIVRTTAFNAGTRTLTVPTMSPVPTTGDAYASVVPIQPEFSTLIVLRTCAALLSSGGNTSYLPAIQAELAVVAQAVLSGQAALDQDKPRTVFSSRG